MVVSGGETKVMNVLSINSHCPNGEYLLVFKPLSPETGVLAVEVRVAVFGRVFTNS